ncbi:phage late control D family protein [Myxococcus sp. RHSTA-1-4]|uniref:phage late control D family protein n=1 Tax=Myxococcus sp. RHSTA-1-4 TaxID=2874601 RepID=UPI001CBCAF21|nr:hypothetical protein [Myxococcus sp. RHSTA-1-4]MBZ4415593.1 hypothetical protein [Myxococcus sp. RHSTA-1-4]
MLAGELGVRLVLWMGRTIPLPPPPAVANALTRVEVTNDADGGDGFQLTFSLSKDRVIDYGLVQDGTLAPFTRVVIGVLMGAVPEVLIDGIITHQELTASGEPGQSTLTVTGRDVSVMMDLEEKNGKYENQPDFAIFTRIIAEYALYGLVPQALPTTDIPIFLQRIPRQHETDLRFIQRMAQRNGYVFYVEPVTFGVNKAYFGPEARLSVPLPALSTNLGPFSNVESLSFSLDGFSPVTTALALLEPISKTGIPLPPLPSLRLPPLALMPVPARRKALEREAAKQGPGQAVATAVAAATRTPDPVTGSGQVDGVRYGAVLRARRLVGVRGAGFSFDGNYYIRRVSHRIERGRYTQSFSLSREGTGALLPVVRP